MAYTSDDLVTQSLSNLGIVRLTDTSTALTRIALVAEAASKIGVLPSGQTLAAEDSATIDARVPTVIADLNARAVVTIADANAIPGGMFDALSAILANAARASYELAGAATAQLAADAVAGERRLYNFGGAAIVQANLDAIFAELGTDDLVNVVDPSDIPRDWFLALAAIVADRVKGKFPLIPPETVMRVKAEGAEAVTTLRRTTRGRPSYNRVVPEWF
jgi:hypothetical protein